MINPKSYIIFSCLIVMQHFPAPLCLNSFFLNAGNQKHALWFQVTYCRASVLPSLYWNYLSCYSLESFLLRYIMSHQWLKDILCLTNTNPSSFPFYFPFSLGSNHSCYWFSVSPWTLSQFSQPHPFIASLKIISPTEFALLIWVGASQLCAFDKLNQCTYSSWSLMTVSKALHLESHSRVLVQHNPSLSDLWTVPCTNSHLTEHLAVT